MTDGNAQRSKRLTLVIRPHASAVTQAKFTLRNGDGMAQFSGFVRMSAIPKLTALVFAAMNER